MERENNKELIKGISVANPVEVEKEYLLYTVEYAKEKGFNHMQFIGPIHDGVKGNIDGMTPYRKYSQFNDEKCLSYIEQALDAIHAACEKTVKYGIKTYVWHHELELPSGFQKAYPEVTNGCGDIEVTHPRVKDFLEHKIEDFFFAYPDIDGIILTLHETKIPLLKLKDQKLGKIERVKYVTQILYDMCKKLGKELIVRPFASLEDDYVMMAQAYEEISTELLIMDKWTQFDWSLCLPNNEFYRKIKNNPLLVEADVFGEFFGKGRLPIMLKEHIAEKFRYCNTFGPRGYVARIDRAGEIPFGDVNEVNIYITHARLEEIDVDKEIDRFFVAKYGKAADKVRDIMEETEDILRKTIYVKGYYFTELSFFPTLNHCKNHYYFEMMTKGCNIVSDEWYIPRNWKRGTLEGILEEKQQAMEDAGKLYEKVLALEAEMEPIEYKKLWVKFCNLKFVTEIWLSLVKVIMSYVQYFEGCTETLEDAFYQEVQILREKNDRGMEILGEKFYCTNAVESFGTGADIGKFVDDICESFRMEKIETERLQKDQEVLDYVICGGAMEGHALQKEVNYSDTLLCKDGLCRIPGNYRGAEWSSITAHGWFSYEVKLKPHGKNRIDITMGSIHEELDVCIYIGDEKHCVRNASPESRQYSFLYAETAGKTSVRIRFEKLSKNIPCVYEVKVRR